MRYKILKIINNRSTLYLVLSIVLVSVLSLTIVYAALATTLNITGTAEISSASWDIYLDNVVLNSGSATTNQPTITDNTKVIFSADLQTPGDYYSFTVDIINNGTIDTMIDSVTKTLTLTETQAKYLNYTIEYQNGESINTKQLLKANSFVRLKVKVEYRNDISPTDLPSTEEILDLGFSVKYIQAEENNTTNISNSGKVVRIVSGDYDTIGSEICIKDECFHVISSDETTVTMFAKYNLYVGGYGNGTLDTYTRYGDEATGLQDPNMRGWVSQQNIRYGTESYATESMHGTELSDYEGSLAESYVNKYVEYLQKQINNKVEGRIINEEELHNLGCPLDGTKCSAENSWVYYTTYWTSVKFNEKSLIRILSNGSSGDLSATGKSGIRPVITISKSDF